MSSFSSIEQSLTQLLVDAMPEGVQVTAVPVQQAASSKARGRRINIAFLRVATDSTARNATTPATSRTGAKSVAPLLLDYLISVHASDYAATNVSASAWIETALRAFESHPVLSPASAEPGGNKSLHPPTLALVEQSLPEWAQLWTALQSPWQPALLVRVRTA